MVPRKLFLVVGLVALIATGCTSEDNPLAPSPGEDTTPPAAPQNVRHVSDNLGFRLAWDENAESDLDGYNVFRFDPDPDRESAWVQMNGAPLSSGSYAVPIEGGEWIYRVRAVDRAGNQSAMSGIVAVTVSGGTGGRPDTIDDGIRMENGKNR